MKKLLLTIGLLFSFSFAAFAQDSQMTRENDVRRVVQDYLGDNIELKQRTISPDAKIIGIHSGSGKVQATPFSKPRKTMKGAIEIHPTQRIVAVDVAFSAATVKVESEFAPFSAGEKTRIHFQYLSLLKVAGEWKIVSVLMPTEFEESAGK